MSTYLVCHGAWAGDAHYLRQGFAGTSMVAEQHHRRRVRHLAARPDIAFFGSLLGFGIATILAVL